MDRHGAYRLLAATLEEHRALPYDELVDLVGTRRTARSDEDWILDVHVDFSDERQGQVRVKVTVDSPSPFRLERVEGEVLVSRTGPAG